MTRRREPQQIGKGPRCPMSDRYSTRANRRDQCEDCGRMLTARADGRWPPHARMSRRPPT